MRAISRLNLNETCKHVKQSEQNLEKFQQLNNIDPKYDQENLDKINLKYKRHLSQVKKNEISVSKNEPPANDQEKI